MAAKNNNITKDPISAGRKGGRRTGERNLTKFKKIFIWEEAEEKIKQNIMEFLNSPYRKERLMATKYFSEFIIAKKRDVSGKIDLNADNVIEIRDYRGQDFTGN